jgi:hypothetical protein
MIRLLIAFECVLMLIIVLDGATSKTADDRRVAEEKATQPQRNAAETVFVAGGPVPALPARNPSPVTPHESRRQHRRARPRCDRTQPAKPGGVASASRGEHSGAARKRRGRGGRRKCSKASRTIEGSDYWWGSGPAVRPGRHPWASCCGPLQRRIRGS